MRVQRIAVAAFIAILLLVVLAVMDRWNASMYAEKIAQIKIPPRAPASGSIATIADLPLPTEETLFGEQIPLGNWFIGQQYDREFYYNCNLSSALLLWSRLSGFYFPKRKAQPYRA